MKPTLVFSAKNRKWYCGVGIRQSSDLHYVTPRLSTQLGSGHSAVEAFLKWRRATDCLFRTRFEQQSKSSEARGLPVARFQAIPRSTRRV